MCTWTCAPGHVHLDMCTSTTWGMTPPQRHTAPHPSTLVSRCHFSCLRSASFAPLGCLSSGTAGVVLLARYTLCVHPTPRVLQTCTHTLMSVARDMISLSRTSVPLLKPFAPSRHTCVRAPPLTHPTRLPFDRRSFDVHIPACTPSEHMYTHMYIQRCTYTCGYACTPSEQENESLRCEPGSAQVKVAH